MFLDRNECFYISYPLLYINLPSSPSTLAITVVVYLDLGSSLCRRHYLCSNIHDEKQRVGMSNYQFNC